MVLGGEYGYSMVNSNGEFITIHNYHIHLWCSYLHQHPTNSKRRCSIHGDVFVSLWLPKFLQKSKENSVREESAVDPYHITGVSSVLSVGCCTRDNFVHLDFQ